MIRRSVSRSRHGCRTPPCYRYALVVLTFLLVASCLSLSVTAQSPTLQPPTPPAIPELPGSPKASEESGGNAGESDDLATALERRGDLNLHGLSLNDALFTIGEQWNINIVAGDVQGTVNGVFKRAPLREILDSILLSNGYNYRAVGKSLVVSSVADLGQINPFFQSATIPVHSADIDEVVEGAKLLSTPQGQIRSLKSARSIVVLDFPDRVEMIREFVAAIESASDRRFTAPDSRMGLPLEVAYFRTQHIPARTAEQALQAVLSKDGRVGVLEKADRLVITDYAENLAMAEKVLVRIDQPRPQVRITALIYDVSLQDVERLGLNWNKIGYDSGSGTAVDVAGATAPFGGLELTDGAITSLTGNAGNIAFGTLSNHFDLNAVVLALRQANDARLLADPNVAVLENEQAIFRSVREIPIQQLTETQQGGTIGTTAFREAGIKLTVTPKVACDDTICMEVAPEFSRFVGSDENGQPIIDTREAKTTLRVANRQTIVIGGLRQRDDVGDFSGIPYLKDLNVVGRLFRARNTTVRESELVVFISPEIISCVDKPNCRQQAAEETLRCRLDQVPEGEGCPPCCRRLPPEMMGTPGEAPVVLPPAHPHDGTHESLPLPDAIELDPQSADQIPSAEFQFGIAGRHEQVRALVTEGRLRRLPLVIQADAKATTPSPAESQQQIAQKPAVAGQLFPAPSSLANPGPVPSVEDSSRPSVWR